MNQNITDIHTTCTYRMEVGDIIVFYNYEKGNNLQIQHFYKYGIKVRSVTTGEFNYIADIIHTDHMIEGIDTDCDLSEENE